MNMEYITHVMYITKVFLFIINRVWKLYDLKSLKTSKNIKNLLLFMYSMQVNNNNYIFT